MPYYDDDFSEALARTEQIRREQLELARLAKLPPEEPMGALATIAVMWSMIKTGVREQCHARREPCPVCGGLLPRYMAFAEFVHETSLIPEYRWAAKGDGYARIHAKCVIMAVYLTGRIQLRTAKRSKWRKRSPEFEKRYREAVAEHAALLASRAADKEHARAVQESPSRIEGPLLPARPPERKGVDELPVEWALQRLAAVNVPELAARTTDDSRAVQRKLFVALFSPDMRCTNPACREKVGSPRHLSPVWRPDRSGSIDLVCLSCKKKSPYMTAGALSRRDMRLELLNAMRSKHGKDREQV